MVHWVNNLTWFAVMALAVGSVLATNAMVAPDGPSKWLWMLQAVTPFVTLNALGGIDASVRHEGESVTCVTMFASCFTVPALALLYFILLSLGYAEGVYYVALAAKLSLWALGHKIILTSHGPKPGSGYRAVQTRSMA